MRLKPQPKFKLSFFQLLMNLHVIVIKTLDVLLVGSPLNGGSNTSNPQNKAFNMVKQIF